MVQSKYLHYLQITKRTVTSPGFTVQNTLFGAVQITKDVNTSHYKYSGYGICFDENSSFSFGNSINAKNVINFGCDMSFSSHANNRTNYIYVLGKDFIQGINGTTIYAESQYKTNFTEQDKKFVLSLHYSGDDSYLFVNGVQQSKFKTKNSEIKRTILTLGNISADSSTTNQTKTGLYGNVYDLAVDYVPISSGGTIYDIHRYLMKKTLLYKMFKLVKKAVMIVLITVASAKNCFLLKDQEYSVKKKQ